MYDAWEDEFVHRVTKRSLPPRRRRGEMRTHKYTSASPDHQSIRRPLRVPIEYVCDTTHVILSNYFARLHASRNCVKVPYLFLV